MDIEMVNGRGTTSASMEDEDDNKGNVRWTQSTSRKEIIGRRTRVGMAR